jgi:hypothetical protein
VKSVILRNCGRRRRNLKEGKRKVWNHNIISLIFDSWCYFPISMIYLLIRDIRKGSVAGRSQGCWRG